MRKNWREYLMEGALLGLFMVSACCFALLLEHPASPVHGAIGNDWARRALMGIAMGVTSFLLVRSPMGARSGAHMNPAVTLTFWRLGKVETADLLGYATGQFAGGVAGVALMSVLFTGSIGHPSVNYVATLPGAGGVELAFAAEVGISFLLMTVVLFSSNHREWSRYTPVFAGVLVALYIAVEAPVSGMSMNPARTFGSALPARLWTALWVYFVAPPVGMLLAAEMYVRTRGMHRVFCAKFHHHNGRRCIFRCRFGEIA
ncbi:MAG: aquaporin [Bryobacteraceae bacterium]